ncbi:MAG: rane protein [Bacteroidetes bacterium]|nr:rane protein [Bacteroidota bacterium]
MTTEWIGYAGVIALALAWMPQSMETIRAGRCDVTLGFLLLGALGSGSLMCYALLRDDMVFSILNALTTLGSLINLYYKLFPRIS